DVVTYEFENVPVASVERLAERVPVYPPVAALRVAQDRLLEKRAFADHHVGTAPFAAVSSVEELLAAIEVVGLPAILKTRRMGYDGKGQLYLADPEQAGPAFQVLGGVPCILEQVVPFDRELSVLAVRGRDGAFATWPLVENRHAGGILRWSYCPADVPPETQARAASIARSVAEGLGYVGVLAIELFEIGGLLLANEMAPRVHNSGHWSIEGAETSQFENHLRAVAGLPLGTTAVPLPVACVNLLGRLPPLTDLLALPGAHVHLYGKEPRPGRKLGHVTLRGSNEAEVRERLDRARRLVEA
ncbi:MAG: 5-(carboxyamino)imidazole ribonucleotide synthase, partial [Myxococcales bacterium]|nr:5-(carboxyamino)imidazole ribonucleotide synthase [Myxococcales bacterium]